MCVVHGHVYQCVVGSEYQASELSGALPFACNKTWSITE